MRAEANKIGTEENGVKDVGRSVSKVVGTRHNARILLSNLNIDRENFDRSNTEIVDR